MKNTFKIITISAAAALALSFAGQQFASAATFKDINNVQDKDKIIALQNSGLIKGISQDLFGPNISISEAEGVQMIVNALDLNLDLIRFVKEPHATDYFKNANDSAWYAEALIIAGVHGLDLPADLKPNQKLTREEFTHQLIDAIEASGQLPMIKPVVIDYKDQDQVKAEYSGSIQRALNYGVLKLDESGKLNPKQEITRAEAAVAISNALAYLKAHPAPAALSETLTAEEAVQLIKEAVGPEADLQIKIDPAASMSRESFTYLLVHTLQTSGQLPMFKLIPVEVADESQMDISNSGAIQTALALGFVTLDESGNFNPKGDITRTAGTDIVNKAVEYLKAHQAPAAESEVLTAEQAVQLIKEAAGPKADLQIKIDPAASMTRESFTYLLVHTLQTSGQLPLLNLIPVEIKDNDKINILNSGAIQTAIALKIVKLDADGKFNPQAGITRTDAAAMVSQVQEILKRAAANQ
ncbi:S-layer homology domain-containing protein [Paenibacillus sp. FSL R10-2736]|uniref:S-layer homology domain-containing protein n=1 Tax=Paenibacillus sp. FSL R10-2736 TaxID=2954692 RepID=UPI0030FA108D